MRRCHGAADASCAFGTPIAKAIGATPRFAAAGGYRFFNVMLMPKLSIMMNDVSKAGFLVMASM